MAIWFDMTNSMKIWQGTNDAGIIRVELEIAKNLHHLDKKVRYFISNDEGFTELKEEDLLWLWEAQNISDAYVKRKGIELKKDELEKWDKPQGLQEAYDFSDSRMNRIRKARELWLYSLQTPTKQFVGKAITFIPFRILKMASDISAVKREKRRRMVKMEKSHYNQFIYPFNNGDTIFSCGLCGSNKEAQFSKLKANMHQIKIGYLIYDLFYVKKETAAIYDKKYFNQFTKYLEWISNNCDYVLYGGETAQKDAEEYFKEHGLRVMEGYPIKFGSEITHHTSKEDEVLRNIGLNGAYILSVGSVIGKKNYNTIYKAYKIMEKKFDNEEIPLLVIVGGKHEGTEELVDVISTDKLTSSKIKIINATDEELDVLYKNAQFTILPSLYEGWSLTLPESLAYKKMCIASDIAPLREIGRELIEYVDPLDPVAWAEKIMYFSQHKKEVLKYNEKIEKEWKKITWEECSQEVLGILKKISNVNSQSKKRCIYYDFSLAYYSSISGASVSGILRTQLLLARYLSRLDNNMKFFALAPEGYLAIDKNSIAPILSDMDIEGAFSECVGHLQTDLSNNIDINKNQEIKEIQKQVFWMLVSVLPQKMQQKLANNKNQLQKYTYKSDIDFSLPFEDNDVVFSCGAGMLEPIYKNVIKQKEKLGFKFVQLIYDYTPVLLPQVHKKETRDFYVPFLKYSALLSDTIFYGGETAKRDGIEYAKTQKLPVRPGVAIKFGSNIVQEIMEDEETFFQDTLKKYGIHGNYIMAVGSIEIRKNHETLYQAYIEMMKQSEDVPQMLFCGYPGWKTKEFCAVLNRDDRVKGKIILMQPTDKELRVLYKNCLFTVLASLYEGWSLTLPESLNYGKFCICTDCDPLKETGKDFVEYVEGYDCKGWAEKILFYYQNPQELKKREAFIAEHWHAISWQECAEQVKKELEKI